MVNLGSDMNCSYHLFGPQVSKRSVFGPNQGILTNRCCYGRYIVFSSNRAKAGAFNIWRMDIDGGNPVQLTHGSGEVQAICSPDGRWLVYSKGGPETSPEAKTLVQCPHQ